MDHHRRQQRLRKSLEEEGLEALYVTNLLNVRYLCGFTGSNGALLLGLSGTWFFTDGRYRTQSAEEVAEAEIAVYPTPDASREAVRKGAEDLAASIIGFESSHVSVATREGLGEIFEGRELRPTRGLVERLRRIKEPEELDLIRRAAEMADAGFGHILSTVEVGKTEREIALDLEVYLRKEGAEAVSFEPIVAAGERSALPHARPTDRTVEKGHFLLFDLGCVYRGYCSDLTRTVVVGPIDERHREVYEAVLAANEAGIAAVRPGAEAREVDAAARDVIAGAGYEEAFMHGLGHGVGIEVHEAPTLRSTSEDVLEAGDVVTVEPGAYFGGWGGVRVEDLVTVVEGGAEVLSKASKELVVL